MHMQAHLSLLCHSYANGHLAEILLKLSNHEIILNFIFSPIDYLIKRENQYIVQVQPLTMAVTDEK